MTAAWVQRLIDRRKKWGCFAESTRSILDMDDEKVLKLKRIYKEIGL